MVEQKNQDDNDEWNVVKSTAEKKSEKQDLIYKKAAHNIKQKVSDASEQRQQKNTQKIIKTQNPV